MNLKVRLNNPVWWAQMLLSVLVPILAYFGLNMQDLTSWAVLFNTLLQAVSNPYVIGTVLVSVWSVCNDPTTKGFADSARAQDYTKPM